jgi:hypothetical protein
MIPTPRFSRAQACGSLRRDCERIQHLRSALAGCLPLFWLVILTVQLRAQPAAVLEFLQPTNSAVYSTRDEIPIALRAVIPDDVILGADVFANQQKIATTSYCCWQCPCAFPLPGTETLLRIPVPREGGDTPPRTWMGWTNVHAGNHRLTASATSFHGTPVEAAPVSITVLDLTLRINVSPDGTIVLDIPQGALVTGGYDAEASEDLQTWTRLGPFEPGNVAAFFWDRTAPPRRWRFYRSVRVPANTP